jgi:addiction module HigA family antidote
MKTYDTSAPIAVHPGEILREMLEDRGLSQSKLARHLKMDASKINEICRGRRGISAEMALILGKAVLLADMLPMINRYPDRPLVLNVAWKTLIYLLASMVIHYAERLIEFSTSGCSSSVGTSAASAAGSHATRRASRSPKRIRSIATYRSTRTSSSRSDHVRRAPSTSRCP